MDQEKIKENVLRVLERKGRMAISNLKLFTAAEETKENFLAVVNVLSVEGKVVKKAGPRVGSFSVALPGTPEKKVAPSNDATKASKTPPSVNRKPESQKARKPAAPREPAPSNGSGRYAAVIADLEAQKAKIEQVIEALRALA